MQSKLALIIRANGTVPIDEGHPHRAEIIQALRSQGHTLLHEENCDHQLGGACSCSPRIAGWLK